MTADHKAKWQCQSCVCKQPKKNNTNTPIRSLEHNINLLEDTPCDNVTIRKRNKSHGTQRRDETASSDDSSFLGDTFCQPHSEIDPQTEPTFQNLSFMITKKLRENNSSLITQLQNTIQTEISIAITQLKQHLKQETDELKRLNTENKLEIEQLKKEIKIIKRENGTLRTEIAELGNNQKPNDSIRREAEENTKKFVIYGMEEYYKEPEYALHTRIIEIFRNSLNLDLMGYIEETRRIGKYQNKSRPLIVELISKRMVKYLLENSHHLQGTGIAISPLLDETKRKERRTLQVEMIKARKNGLYATIRDNQLYIQGKRIQQNNYNNNTTYINAEPEDRIINNKHKHDHQENIIINNRTQHSFRH